MSRSAKCRAKGCPGVAVIETDGRGGTVERCECCEKREAWRAKHIPTSRRYVCEICGGTIVAGRTGGAPKYCLACRPIAGAAQKVAKKAAARASVVPIRPLRTA